MIAKAVFHQGTIKIHYQYKSRAKRINTQIKVNSSEEITADGKLKSTVPNRNEKQIKINEFKKQAQELIDDFFYKNKTYPTGKEFDNLWLKKEDILIKSDSFLDYYERFIKYKSKDRNISTQDSLKDYRSLKKNIGHYQEYIGRDVLIGDMNNEWLVDFENYLKRNVGDDNLTAKLEHKPSTLRKRLRTIKAFYIWMNVEGIFPLPKVFSNFKLQKERAETVKAVLTKDEIKQLYSISFNDEKLDFIKDVFVFSCYTGLRFSDLISLRKNHIKQLKLAGISIVKIAEKTKYEFRVPLNKIALEILQKYDYNFNKYTNANFNKYLHKLLESTELFDDELEFNGKVKKRWEAISIHNGRDTFITLLIQQRVPLNEIMKYTGHKSVTNLNNYIDTKSEVLNFVNELIE